MKLPWIIARLALYTVLSTMGIALGCNGPEDQTMSASNVDSSSSSSNAGSGGADGGEHCPCGEGACSWSGAGGGVSIPDCPVLSTSIFEGTIDGKPYSGTFTDTMTASGSIPGTLPPFTAITGFSGGDIRIEWGEPNLRGVFLPITAGEITLPGHVARKILPGSTFRIKCGDFIFQYILTVEGGQLTGCTSG